MQSDHKTVAQEDCAERSSSAAYGFRYAKRWETLIRWALSSALIAFVFGIAVLAAVPPVDRDALTHHLAIPMMFLRNGGIYEIPHVPFSYYPMNLDLLYVIPLYFGNDIVPKYIHFSFALLTTGLVISYLYRRFHNAIGALIGGLLFLSLPVIIKLSITVYVDLGLIFFSTASILQLLRWAETGFRSKHLMLSGIFTGLCLGTKPNGMLVFFLLVLAVPFLYRPDTKVPFQKLQQGQRQHSQMAISIKALVLSVAFAVVAMLVYSPWMLRNYVWTGNPIYPMAVSIFGPASPMSEKPREEADKALANYENDEPTKDRANYGPFVLRRLAYGETLLEILAIPVRVFIQGQDDNPRLFDGRLNPYLLVFPLIAVLMAKGRRRSELVQLEIRLLGAFSLLHLLFALFLVDMRVRYIGPIIPPLVILTVIGIHDLIDLIKSRLSRLQKWVALSATGVISLWLLGLNAAYLVGQFGTVDPMSYLQGKLSRDEYIQKYRPEYAAISFANRNLPENSRILALFNGNRSYYSEREMICDNESFQKAVNASKSSSDLAKALKQRGISHLLIRLDLFSQWAESQFKPDQKAVLQTFFKETLVRLYQGHGYALFAVTVG
jgi:4-amino-4-deoxy-L-arabinose transferase-like glycosyltransferase